MAAFFLQIIRCTNPWLLAESDKTKETFCKSTHAHCCKYKAYFMCTIIVLIIHNAADTVTCPPSCLVAYPEPLGVVSRRARWRCECRSVFSQTSLNLFWGNRQWVILFHACNFKLLYIDFLMFDICQNTDVDICLIDSCIFFSRTVSAAGGGSAAYWRFSQLNWALDPSLSIY